MMASSTISFKDAKNKEDFKYFKDVLDTGLNFPGDPEKYDRIVIDFAAYDLVLLKIKKERSIKLYTLDFIDIIDTGVDTILDLAVDEGYSKLKLEQLRKLLTRSVEILIEEKKGDNLCQIV